MTMFGPPTYSLVKAILGEGGQIRVVIQPQEKDGCWFSFFFLPKLCPCSIKKNEENSGRGSRSGKGKMKKKVGKKMRERKYNDASLEKEASLSIFCRLEAFEISVVLEGERERGRSE